MTKVTDRPRASTSSFTPCSPDRISWKANVPARSRGSSNYAEDLAKRFVAEKAP